MYRTPYLVPGVEAVITHEAAQGRNHTGALLRLYESEPVPIPLSSTWDLAALAVSGHGGEDPKPCLVAGTYYEGARPWNRPRLSVIQLAFRGHGQGNLVYTPESDPEVMNYLLGADRWLDHLPVLGSPLAVSLYWSESAEARRGSSPDPAPDAPDTDPEDSAPEKKARLDRVRVAVGSSAFRVDVFRLRMEDDGEGVDLIPRKNEERSQFQRFEQVRVGGTWPVSAVAFLHPPGRGTPRVHAAPPVLVVATADGALHAFAEETVQGEPTYRSTGPPVSRRGVLLERRTFRVLTAGGILLGGILWAGFRLWRGRRRTPELQLARSARRRRLRRALRQGRRTLGHHYRTLYALSNHSRDPEAAGEVLRGLWKRIEALDQLAKNRPRWRSRRGRHEIRVELNRALYQGSNLINRALEDTPPPEEGGTATATRPAG